MSKTKKVWFVLGTVIVGTLGFLAAATASPRAASFNCKIVSCPAPQCLDGEHLEVPAGQCCPVCVPD
jgi:hypothetical protein